MESEFPKQKQQFLNPKDFQDQEVYLTYKGWSRKANEDTPPSNAKSGISWKEKLKYQLRYTYPEFAKDEAGEPRLDKNGNPFRNMNWIPEFPQGYSIKYHFDEGTLESGSLPLWNAFCRIQPTKGDQIIIKRTGLKEETKWEVRKTQRTAKSTQEEVIHNFEEPYNELEPDENVPF